MFVNHFASPDHVALVLNIGLTYALPGAFPGSIEYPQQLVHHILELISAIRFIALPFGHGNRITSRVQTSNKDRRHL